MSDLHAEKYFENDVIARLTDHGWVGGDPARHDAERALYPEDALWRVRYEVRAHAGAGRLKVKGVKTQ